ncbi:MAG: septum formation initiator family protein [Victivallaceae bacterium]|jgi:cell division protein FtsB|nr:septum formation initiator family protein [Victivallaceae bacterium]MDD3702987.1 septum formation initiator family protein [Victivallaceae bacterium]MDD4317250.1 septum formation initiator family protein [Victivallaceae bacterium]MDD5663010.1 septum formation initiator family protein [Victivallaceae bacterium]NLK83493.1 septum formation initiator family protein [Lentisphaerota bacterium]
MASGRKKFILTMIYFILILLFVVAVLLIWPAYRDYRKKQNDVYLLKDQASEKRRIRAELEHDVKALQSQPEAVEKVAREKFGLCEEGETVILYNPPPEPNKNTTELKNIPEVKP